MTAQHTPGPWVEYNPLTAAYDTKDGTHVAAEIAENMECFADAFNIAAIRANQRAAIQKATHKEQA